MGAAICQFQQCLINQFARRLTVTYWPPKLAVVCNICMHGGNNSVLFSTSYALGQLLLRCTAEGPNKCWSPTLPCCLPCDLHSICSQAKAYMTVGKLCMLYCMLDEAGVQTSIQVKGVTHTLRCQDPGSLDCQACCGSAGASS